MSDIGRDPLLADESAAAALQEWQRVYEGLSEEEIAAVEALALDRSHFLREEPRLLEGWRSA